MKHFRKISDYAMIGGLSAVVVVSLVACGNQNEENQSSTNANVINAVQKGAFVILEEQADGSYKISEEYPSTRTHIVVRSVNGDERVLSEEEINRLVKQEEAKIDSGASELTNPNSSGGLGLGGALLASAAGAIIGSYIGNKLFNNPAYRQNQQRNYKSPQAYERSQNSFKNTSSSTSRSSATPSNAKRGFFGGNSNSGRSSSNFGS